MFTCTLTVAQLKHASALGINMGRDTGIPVFPAAQYLTDVVRASIPEQHGTRFPWFLMADLSRHGGLRIPPAPEIHSRAAASTSDAMLRESVMLPATAAAQAPSAKSR